MALETSDILTQVVRDTIALLKCDDASIVLWDDKQNTFDQGAATNIQLNDTIAQRVRREGGVTRWIIDHQRSLVINDMQKNPFPPNPMTLEKNIQAFMAVPVTYDGERLGVLFALSYTPNVFYEEQTTALETLAHMAAIAILNARLVNSLRSLNDFKNAMMGLAAHDLRNPLSRVVGYIDILLMDFRPLSEEQEQWVRSIWAALEQMGDLIDGILHYERLNQEGANAHFEKRELNELVVQVVEPFKNDASHKSQSITIDLAQNPLYVSIDKFLIGEAIANLVSNAIKYASYGTEITIRTLQNPHEYQVQVIDQGAGIPPEFHERVFQPFTRLPSAKSQRGSGLGLSLVKMIIERHNGKISLESDLGQGSKFTLHFHPIPLAD